MPSVDLAHLSHLDQSILRLSNRHRMPVSPLASRALDFAQVHHEEGSPLHSLNLKRSLRVGLETMRMIGRTAMKTILAIFVINSTRIHPPRSARKLGHLGTPRSSRPPRQAATVSYRLMPVVPSGSELRGHGVEVDGEEEDLTPTVRLETSVATTMPWPP